MKKKLKIVAHGTQWVDPNPPPVIICPECGGEKLINTFNLDRCYKNFLQLILSEKATAENVKTVVAFLRQVQRLQLKQSPHGSPLLFL